MHSRGGSGGGQLLATPSTYARPERRLSSKRWVATRQAMIQARKDAKAAAAQEEREAAEETARKRAEADAEALEWLTYQELKGAPTADSQFPPIVKLGAAVGGQRAVAALFATELCSWEWIQIHCM
eukprot:COSAG01_NODE_416_length_17299_cov_62.219186_3_plen_126_part_00